MAINLNYVMQSIKIVDKLIRKGQNLHKFHVAIVAIIPKNVGVVLGLFQYIDFDQKICVYNTFHSHIILIVILSLED